MFRDLTIKLKGVFLHLNTRSQSDATIHYRVGNKCDNFNATENVHKIYELF